MPEVSDFPAALASYQAGAFATAQAAARRLLALQPAAGRTMHLLALAFHQLGHNRAADRWLQCVDPLLPPAERGEALTNRGSVLLAFGRKTEALAIIDKAAALEPMKARPLCVRAAIQRAALMPVAALGSARRAASIEPGLAEAWTAAANALQAAGAAEIAVHAYARAIALAPDDIVAHGNKLFTLSFVYGTDDERLFRETRRWSERVERVWAPPPRRPVAPRQRLRLGYHSFEFHRRSLLDDYFPPVLRQHDRKQVELILFADGGRRDSRTEELQGLADRWVDLAGLDLAGKVERMRGADLDIAVCLTGYLPIHRIVFAPRVAPIQVAHMNHVATTGLKAFDYRITDRWLDPPGETERWNVERLVRLERGYVPMAPPEPSPDVQPLPASKNGFITFGSFNNLTKITPATLALWARTLEAVPGSRLLLKARVLEDPAVRAAYAERSAAAGIAVERIDFIGEVPGHPEHLETIGRADIGLDPVPFSGGHSTIEALWMGVPIVNLRSPGLVGRLGASLLSRAGLGEFVAFTMEEFVAKAAGLAHDMDRLAALRGRMRAQLRQSTLCDAAGYTRELEAAFRAMAYGEV